MKYPPSRKPPLPAPGMRKIILALELAEPVQGFGENSPRSTLREEARGHTNRGMSKQDTARSSSRGPVQRKSSLLCKRLGGHDFLQKGFLLAFHGRRHVAACSGISFLQCQFPCLLEAFGGMAQIYMPSIAVHAARSAVPPGSL